jgi:CheY-like chemotaxis protein
VVDDSQDSAESLTRLLSLMGCEATSITDPRQALAEALSRTPHIVFLDLGMPHIDGYELARQLRRHFDSDQLKVVAITGYGSPRDRKASRQAGFDAHVVKPIDPALLESILRTVIPSPR